MEAALTRDDAEPIERVENFFVQQVRRWFDLCDLFLDWQHDNLTEREPSPAVLEKHRCSLKWMLRFARIMHTEACDPEFPDHSVISGLEIRIKQLESSWSMFHDQHITDAQADAIIAHVFPE